MEETNALLDRVTLADNRKPAFRRSLTVLVQVAPDADIFPVRARYVGAFLAHVKDGNGAENNRIVYAKCSQLYSYQRNSAVQQPQNIAETRRNFPRHNNSPMVPVGVGAGAQCPSIRLFG